MYGFLFYFSVDTVYQRIRFKDGAIDYYPGDGAASA
jgi:hypothetical protein